MSTNTFLNPSLNLDSLFPTLNDESFLQFLKEYYKFLQSTKISLENVSGTYVKGETVVGLKSRAFGTILAIGENELIVLMKTEKPLDSTERLTGSTSGATGIITGIKDNVIRESGRLKQARSQYVSGDEFFQLLKDEVNRGYPSSSEADRRALYNRIRELFESKSTEEAYRFLFKAFFDENVEIRFPGDDLLRVSDGKFDQTSLIRCVPENTHPFPEGTVFDFLNKTVRGEQSGAIAQCVNVLVSFLGGIRFAELQLKLVSGEFVPGETVTAIEQPRLSTTTFGLIGDINIIDRGSGYSVGDLFTITGDGAEAIAEVFSISQAPIDKLIENEVGIGYRLNQRATIDNTNTGGGGLIVQVTGLSNTYTVTDGSNNYTVGDISKISIVNRGSGYVRVPRVILVDTTIKTLGLLSSRLIRIDDPGENYSVGDTLTFTGGSGIDATGTVASVGTTTSSLYGEDSILFEDGFILTQEENIEGIFSAIKNEEWANEGPILRLELTNFGSGYTSTDLPIVTIESSDTANGTNATFSVIDVQGSSANVVVDVANNTVGIGSIRFINIINPGLNYSFANVDASQIGDGNAILEPDISGISVNLGTYLNDDGKANFKIIQDSLFYQDFSYVIRSGLIIDAYKELVKETVHPAGLEFFGEIVITSLISLRADFRSQIDQSPRPLALSSFVSLFPVGVSIPPTQPELQIHLEPLRIDQALIGVNDFNIREIEITPATIDQLADFNREIVNRLHLFIDVSLFPTFSDVVTGALPSIPAELDYILAGAIATISTDKEYQIKIAPIPMVQPLAVRGFNIREIEITPLADLAIEVERVKLQDDSFIADQYGETPISFFAEDLISSLSSTTFLEFTGFETPVARFSKKIDTQGFEIDIELFIDASLDIVFNDVQILDTSTSDVILKLEPTLIDQALIGVRDFNIRRIEIAPYIDMATQPVPEYTVGILLYVNVALDIVFNDVSILETSISDVILKLEPAVAPVPVSVRDFNIREIEIVKNIELDAQTIAEYEIDVFTEAQTKVYYNEQIIALYAETEISELQDIKFNDIFQIPLRSNGIVSQSYEIDIELPMITVAAIVTPTRIFVDRLRIPTLGLGATVIDASVNFDGTSYELEFLPQFVQFAPRVIPQDTGRVKTLSFTIPPVRATVNSLLDSIRISPEEIDVAPIPRMRLEIDVIAESTNSNLNILNFNIREIDITPYLDMRMAFYSEILTMTNRVHTTEIDILSEIDVALITKMKLKIDVTTGFVSLYDTLLGDIIISSYNDALLLEFQNKTFEDTSPRYRGLSKSDIDYRLEIVPYVDSRMRFYTEILTMTNRVHTTEIDLFLFTNASATIPKGIVVNQKINSALIDVSLQGVRDFNIREIKILPYIDSRMRFYSEILEMTNREATVEIDVIAETVSLVSTPTKPIVANRIVVPKVIDTSVDVRNFNIRRIEIDQYIDMVSTIDKIFEIDSIADQVSVRTNHVKNVDVNYFRYADVPIIFLADETLESRSIGTGPTTDSDEITVDSELITADESQFTFLSRIFDTFTTQVSTTSYEIDIVPTQNVAAAFISSDNIFGVGETTKSIELYIDSRMRFYSEILEMTNREATVEIDVIAETVSVIVVPIQDIPINFGIKSFADMAIDVRNFNIRRIEIDPYIDMASTIDKIFEIDSIADSVEVTTKHGKDRITEYYQLADIAISILANEVIENNINSTFDEPTNITTVRRIPSTMYEVDLEPFENVASAFVSSDNRVGSLFKFIELNIDSRMRFYSEILEMTNREATVEIDVIGETVSVIVVPIQDIPINYVIKPFIDATIKLSKEIRTIVELSALDVRMAFYSEVYTMTGRVHTTEIEIFGFTDIAKVVPQKTDIDYVIKPFIDATISIEQIREIDITPETMNLRMSFYSEILEMTNRVHTTEIEIFSISSVETNSKTTSYKIDINLDSFKPIGQERLDYFIGKTINEFSQFTFEDEFNVNSATPRTENVSEIEIPSFGFAPISGEDIIIEIETVPDQVNVTTKHGKVVTENYFGFADVPLLVLENDPISDYSDNSFDESPGISFSEIIPPTFYRIEVQPLKDVVAFMPLEEISGRLEKVLPAYADLKLSFYSEILEMTNRVHTTEIEIFGFTDIAKVVPQKTDIDYVIKPFIDSTIDFNVRIVPYGDVPIEEFENNQIQSIELLTFDLEFSNLNITKNVFIDGTVSFIDPGLSAIRVIRFKNDSIESLENTNFEDESGFKVAGVGINTTFTDDFLVGDALITPTEKFLVTAVANNEYLEINVNPEENYDDVSVYKEFFV
jgi:hypothetical protein